MGCSSSNPDVVPQDGVMLKQVFHGKKTAKTSLHLLSGDGKFSGLTMANLVRKRAEQHSISMEALKKYQKWIDLCDISVITIPGGDGQDMEVQIIKSKANKDRQGMACFCNFHSGAVMLTAEAENGYWCRLATMVDLVCFNINYRIGPEAQTT